MGVKVNLLFQECLETEKIDKARLEDEQDQEQLQLTAREKDNFQEEETRRLVSACIRICF